MNILVYRLSALGDVAMTIPAIYSCASAWPQHTFHVVTTAFCAQLFIHHPENIKLHPITPPVKTGRLLAELNHLQIDAVADLHNVLRSWIVDIMFLVKGKKVRMLKKMRSKRKAIMEHRTSTVKPYTQRYFDVFERLGLNCSPTFSSLFPVTPPLPVNFAKNQERWIGIAPFARYNNKTYPLEKMQQVVRQLSAQPTTRIFLFGSRGHEATVLKQWESLSPNVLSVAGLFSLKEELALMAHLDVMLSMDSSNMHMASLAGTRVVSVWGSTTPACGFLGWQQSEKDAACLNIPCQPCTIGGSNHCKKETMECLEGLSPEILTKLILK